MSESVNIQSSQVLSNGSNGHVFRSNSNRADRQFSIKRTRSEVGYVYWILEGFGKHKCFVLCDSWEEAMDQAKARLESEKEDSQEFIFADGL